MERPNRLVMLVGPTPGAEFTLDQERLTIGRAEDATISVNHNSVSRLHCEVHALGDGRYEIVDKGSSNGVRVNYSDLRRGIIEAGDIIELGDVKFRFVGAGQIFRPGVTESQMLTAIGERAATAVVGPRRPGSALPYVIFGLVVAAGAAGAWLITHPPRGDSGQTPSSTTTMQDAEQRALDDAKKLCRPDDCDKAHKKVSDLISKDSPLRQTQAFRDIENTWADTVLAHPEQQSDVSDRKRLLHEIEADSSIDEPRRRTATDQLALLEAMSTNPSSLAALRDGGIASIDQPPIVILPATRDAGPFRRPPPPQPTTEIASPTPTLVPGGTGTKPPPATTDALDRDRTLIGQGNFVQAQKDLEQRVYSGKGSAEDLRALKAVCRKNGDKNCVDTVNRIQNQNP